MCPDHADWLGELGAVFEIAWATAWGEGANRLICREFGLPPFPVVVLPAPPFDPTEKLPAVASFAGDRPAAWLDDIVTDQMRAWAAARPAATLVVEISPAVGLTRDVVDALLAWRIVPE